jgi:DNA-binding transcriptional LysR family regulator
MQDLNDLYYFVQIVAHSGFAAAGRALGVPKSKLSRRVALLEERLGVRLIQRSTRHFSVTEIGQRYYAHCQAMLVEAEAAQSAVDQTRTAPCGIVRLSCPVALLHACVGSMLADFLTRYPQVELKVEATNRRVDVIAEGIDIAIRARPPPIEDSYLMLRILAEHGHVLVASPALLQRSGDIKVPADLSGRPSLGQEPPLQEHLWQLEGPDGAQAMIRHHPRLVSDDMLTLRAAALAGVGVVRLPLLMVSDDLRAQKLVRLLPDWAPRRDLIHAVYPSRRGLLPSVRALLDEFAMRFRAIAGA